MRDFFASEPIKMVCDLLRLNRDWTKDNHVWWHPSGITISMILGTHVMIGANNKYDYGLEGNLGFWDYLAVGRAMRDAKRQDRIPETAHKNDASAKSISAVAQRIQEMYGTT